MSVSSVNTKASVLREEEGRKGERKEGMRRGERKEERKGRRKGGMRREGGKAE